MKLKVNSETNKMGCWKIEQLIISWAIAHGYGAFWTF
jgi:hypothetical protein